ncbi:hypothetical protein L227DRAFT_430440 [Lentinus tigrinus ALCF2SS1-6]|uniref:Uncharacterized protein n=1 Tax=Lentinus tigrinus ALCF2SS1-6 TaxID=1328759 RepID=A0A5C2SFP5_9APHY|nr:hypothetical protein L227DRAFT_430440 [Lentinus tigrinus ALCF2SS1-6]
MHVDQVICQSRVLPRVAGVGSRIYAPFALRRSRLSQVPGAQRWPIRSCLRPEYAVGIEHVGGSKCSTIYPTFRTTHSSPVIIPFSSRAVQVAAPTPAVCTDSSSYRRRPLQPPRTGVQRRLFNASGHPQRAMTKHYPSRGTSCFAMGSGTL